MVEGEKKVVLVVKLRWKLDLHLRTRSCVKGLQQRGMCLIIKPDPYLIVEVGVLRVMQDCGTGCCDEDWTSWLAINALKKIIAAGKWGSMVMLS